ncbi:hypothetical protein IKE83_02640 [Candidatus Saccharibacteria bacterium]|nr:hypothetical protein [Candidatus Saccharibacteria bacterium]
MNGDVGGGSRKVSGGRENCGVYSNCEVHSNCGVREGVKLDCEVRENVNPNPSDYEDIINLPHFHAPGRPFMSMEARAAQFAAYKALGEEFM